MSKIPDKKDYLYGETPQDIRSWALERAKEKDAVGAVCLAILSAHDMSPFLRDKVKVLNYISSKFPNDPDIEAAVKATVIAYDDYLREWDDAFLKDDD